MVEKENNPEQDWRWRYSTWRERIREREKFKEEFCDQCFFRKRVERDLKSPLPEKVVKQLKQILETRCSLCKEEKQHAKTREGI